MGNSICWYFLVKCTQLFSRFHSQKPRTNLSSCIQIPIALSFADVPCGVPSPSLFRNNWSCHRHSDAAARSHTLDSTCSSGILTPQPPALSWTIVVGSPSQDLCNPSHLELSQSYADAIQAFQTRRLSVDLSCWWSFQEMLGCLKCLKQAMMKRMKMMKIHQSTRQFDLLPFCQTCCNHDRIFEDDFDAED